MGPLRDQDTFWRQFRFARIRPISPMGTGGLRKMLCVLCGLGAGRWALGAEQVDAKHDMFCMHTQAAE